MDILGKMLPYVLRGMNQPYLKIKLQKTYTSYVGKQKSVCACATACVHMYLHTYTQPSLWKTATVA